MHYRDTGIRRWNAPLWARRDELLQTIERLEASLNARNEYAGGARPWPVAIENEDDAARVRETIRAARREAAMIEQAFRE